MGAIVVISLIAILASGCELVGPDHVEVRVSIDREFYHVGDTIHVSVVNHGNVLVSWDGPWCGSDWMWKWNDPEWSLVMHPRTCPRALPPPLLLRPGERHTFTSVAPGPGIYRYQFWMRTEDHRPLPEDQRTSEIFTVVGSG